MGYLPTKNTGTEYAGKLNLTVLCIFVKVLNIYSTNIFELCCIFPGGALILNCSVLIMPIGDDG